MAPGLILWKGIKKFTAAVIKVNSWPNPSQVHGGGAICSMDSQALDIKYIISLAKDTNKVNFR